MKIKILALGLACLILVSSSFAESKMGTIQREKSLLWSFTTYNPSHITATAMWNKMATDLDIGFFVFDGDELMLIGIGAAETELFETVTIGVYEDDEIYVMLTNWIGPSAKYQLNVHYTDSQDFDKASLQFIGEFSESEASTSSMDTIAKKAITKLKRLKYNFR